MNTYINNVPQPLPLQGTYNTRDIGGYATKENKSTKKGQFLRSDGLSELSQSDVKTLLDYGVRCVIDLRSNFEKERDIESEELLKQVDYYSIPMLDKAASNNFVADMANSMGEVYVSLLEKNAKEFIDIIHIIAKYKSETVLFHCSAGKDRTGVTAMLLLLLAGVDIEQIVADYSVSQSNMQQKFEKQKRMMKQNHNIDMPEYVFSSEPKELEMALEYLQDNYNLSAEEYFIKNGVNIEALQITMSKLCED